MRVGPSIRLRLTLFYVGLLVAGTTLLLGLSWWLLGNQLERTLPTELASQVLGQLGLQYALAVAGTALVALGVGWLAAGRALAPIRTIVTTLRRISEDRLDARVRPSGPADELHDLAVAFDSMLDRVEGAVEAQRRFVANASHELRTPLTVMRTEAEVALDDPDASVEELREVARAVVESTERTELLLDRLLLLAVSTEGARRDDLVDLAAVARRAASTVAGEAAAAGVHVRLQLDPVRVRGDELLLERLIGNLAENAVRHGRAGGAATIRVRERGDEVELSVASEGDVVAPEDVARLGQPFERLRRERAPGTGLGLSIVRAVAEAHGGRLALEAPSSGGLIAGVRIPAVMGA
jgi:two-component system, OmpR family, sensor histidine kinase VanS